MKHSQSRRQGFSLVELTVVVAIMGLLATLALPSYEKAMDRARSTQCGQNLHQIGLAVLAAAQDNDNKYPSINDPIAQPPYYPDDPTAKTLPQTLASYGIGNQILRCPSDVRTPPNYFAQYGCSYLWYPIADDESSSTNSVDIYSMRGQIFQRPPAKVRIVSDYNTVHYNRFNSLYADGHVSVRYK